MFTITRTLRTLGLLALLTPAVAGAQSATTRTAPASLAPFTEETRIGSAGIGVGGLWGGTGLYAGYERGVTRVNEQVVLSIGGQIGYIRDDFEGVVTASYVPIMVTANAHLAVPSMPKLDLYGGISAGYAFANFSTRDSFDRFGLTVSGEAYGLQAGARYEVTSKTSAYVQLGVGDMSRLQAGVALKF